jgi:DNA polymerase III subunit delta
MKIEKILQNITSNNIQPVYLILGEQDYLINQIKNQFTSLIPQAERSMNLATYDAESQNISTAIDDAMSLPFFGEHRLVIINNPYFLSGAKSKTNIDQDIDGLIEYVKHPQESTILVIIASYSKIDARKKVTKVLKRQAKVLDLTVINERDTYSYLSSEINRQGYTIDSKTLTDFFQRVNGDLTLAMNALPKLLLYCHDSKEITSYAVNNLIQQSLNQNVFDLVGYVMNKDAKHAVDFYHDLILEDKQPLQINAALLSQFRLLLQTFILHRKGNSQGTIAEKLKVHPYRIKLALQNIRSYNFDSLRDAYLGLIQVEEKLKSTNESPELLFQMFTLKFVDNQIQ